MIFRQITHDDLGCASYLVGDIRDVPTAIDEAVPVAVICGSGQRSAVAASLRQRFGGEQIIRVVDGGVPLWMREGRPTEQPATAKA